MRKDTGTTKTTIKSFLKKVYPEPNTGCWLWGGSVSKFGYGRTLNKHLKIHNAHRLSFYLFNGEFNREKFVLHKCDITSCVNPDHLYLGDQAQNMIDRDSRNRRKPPVGSLSGRAKINESIAERIKFELKSGKTIKETSIKIGVTLSCVADISSGRTWK